MANGYTADHIAKILARIEVEGAYRESLERVSTELVPVNGMDREAFELAVFAKAEQLGYEREAVERHLKALCPSFDDSVKMLKRLKAIPDIEVAFRHFRRELTDVMHESFPFEDVRCSVEYESDDGWERIPGYVRKGFYNQTILKGELENRELAIYRVRDEREVVRGVWPVKWRSVVGEVDPLMWMDFAKSKRNIYLFSREALVFSDKIQELRKLFDVRLRIGYYFDL